MSLETALIDLTQKHVLRNATLDIGEVDFKDGKFTLTIRDLTAVEVLRVAEMVRKARP